MTVRELVDTLHEMMARNSANADREVVVWTPDYETVAQHVVDHVGPEEDECDHTNVVVVIRSVALRAPRRRGP